MPSASSRASGRSAVLRDESRDFLRGLVRVQVHGHVELVGEHADALEVRVVHRVRRVRREGGADQRHRRATGRARRRRLSKYSSAVCAQAVGKSITGRPTRARNPWRL